MAFGNSNFFEFPGNSPKYWSIAAFLLVWEVRFRRMKFPEAGKSYKEILKEKEAKLIELGAEELAKALISVSELDDTAMDLVDRLLSNPDENLKKFRTKLEYLRKQDEFVSWRRVSAYADELSLLIRNLLESGVDPRAGFEAMVSFYESDEDIFNSCDDSCGEVGYVFTEIARQAFIEFASQIDDKEFVTGHVLGLVLEDDFGVRSCLLDSAMRFLNEEQIRLMIHRLQLLVQNERNEYGSSDLYSLMESLARQIKDAEMYEELRLEHSNGTTFNACLDVAKVYFECGDIKRSMEWVSAIPDEGKFRCNEKDELLAAIYKANGDKEKQADLAWRRFEEFRSIESLDELLSVIGLERKKEVIGQAIQWIQSAHRISYEDLKFLVDAGCVDEADKYILERSTDLDGRRYDVLLPAAEALENEERNLAAYLIYRSLADSILERGNYKNYSIAVNYLCILDELAGSIEDWQGLMNHEDYHSQLKEVHGRKSSFWKKYERRLQFQD